jgi:signal transduction histidine kinase
LYEAKQQAELYLDLMGHDIRNMNMIGMGFLELAMGSTDIKNEDKEYLLKSLGSLENSTRLIDNVRKLQKARSGELEHQEVDACEMFLRVLAHFSSMPGVKVSFNYDIPPSCLVRADELLYEVFENVVGNAIKHGGPETVIDVRFDQFAADGRTYNRFIVEDNGPGIPDARKGRIFNRLQRGDSKAHGTGLGLYLVKSLVESYGGRVSVEDRVLGDHTKGARFVVMLPAVNYL